MIQEFLAWAKNKNWKTTTRKDDFVLPDAITQRYKIPAQWLTFIRHFSICANENETKCFLTFEDFGQVPDGAFHWNEFELISLEAADDDVDWQRSIKSFWDKHLPIFIGVSGEYEYYAINIESGNVVHGFEPEFEEAKIVSDSFDSFIEKIISNEIEL